MKLSIFVRYKNWVAYNNSMKQFDKWNKLKNKVNEKQPEFFVNEREVRYAHLGLNVGYEEDGKGVDFK